MSGIFILVYGPITLAILALALVRLLVRPKLTIPTGAYTGAQARIVVKGPDGRVLGEVKSFAPSTTHYYNPDHVYVLKDPK